MESLETNRQPVSTNKGAIEFNPSLETNTDYSTQHAHTNFILTHSRRK